MWERNILFGFGSPSIDSIARLKLTFKHYFFYAPMSGTGIFIRGVGSRETEGCNLPARALVTSNSFKFSHLRQLPNLYFASTYMAKTNTETNTSRRINIGM